MAHTFHCPHNFIALTLNGPHTHRKVWVIEAVPALAPSQEDPQTNWNAKDEEESPRDPDQQHGEKVGALIARCVHVLRGFQDGNHKSEKTCQNAPASTPDQQHDEKVGALGTRRVQVLRGFQGRNRWKKCQNVHLWAPQTNRA